MDPNELANFSGRSPERFVPELMAGEMIAAQHIGRYLWACSAAPDRRVLDAGCGMAYGTAMLAEAGAREVVGVDLAEEVLSTVREQVPSGVRLERADLRELPFDEGSFDLVVCFEVIEHIVDQEAVVAEFARVLAPDGVLLASTPNRAVSDEDNPHHLRELLPEELEGLLAGHFERVELFRQESWYSSAVLDDETFASTTTLPGPWTVQKIAAGELGTEQFTIAAASNAALPTLGGSVALTRDKTGELVKQIRRTHDTSTKRRERLKAMQERLNATQGQLSAAQKRLDATQERLETTQKRLEAKKKRLAAKKKRLAAKKRRLARAEASLEESGAERKRLAEKSLQGRSHTGARLIVATARSALRRVRRHGLSKRP